MSLPGFFGSVLKRLKGFVKKAPPPVAGFVPVAKIAPPFAKRVFAPTGEAKRAQERAKVHGKVPAATFPVAKIVPEAKVVREAKRVFRRQEAGGEATFEELTDARVQEYLYFGQWLPVSSSNVAAIQYDYRAQLLTIRFLNHGSEYEYPGIDPDLAYTFAVSLSKGQWVWENLRNTFRAYQFVRSADGHVPRRQMKLDIHGNVVGAGNYVFSKKAEKRVAQRLFQRR